MRQVSGLLLELPEMHPADAVYRFVRGLKPQIRLHVELQRPTTVNSAILLAQAAETALNFTRPTSSPTYMGPQPMQLGALTLAPKLSLAEHKRLFKGASSSAAAALDISLRRTPSSTPPSQQPPS